MSGQREDRWNRAHQWRQKAAIKRSGPIEIARDSVAGTHSEKVSQRKPLEETHGEHSFKNPTPGTPWSELTQITPLGGLPAEGSLGKSHSEEREPHLGKLPEESPIGEPQLGNSLGKAQSENPTLGSSLRTAHSEKLNRGNSIGETHCDKLPWENSIVETISKTPSWKASNEPLGSVTSSTK
jgi:hypothetical protein